MALEYISGATGQDKVKDGFRKTNEAIANIIVSATTSGSTLTLTKFDGTTFTATTGSEKSYKDFSFFFTQTGTSNPDITILENDLGETPECIRANVGAFVFTGNSIFTVGKTVLLPSFDPEDNFYFTKLNLGDASLIAIVCKDMLGNLKDEIDSKFLQIRIYN